MKIRKKN